MGDEYRSRNFRPDAHDKLLRQMLRSLADDAAASDPAETLPSGKDHRAFSALRIASELVDAVAGWAVDHVYGLSLAGRKMLPRQPMGSKDHPDYLASRTVADDHEHERRGGLALEKSAPPNSPAERRLILRNLVFAGAGAFPAWLRAELLEALDALDVGKTMPLLEQSPRTGAKFFKAKARLKLITFVIFRSRAYGTTKTEEMAVISDETGLSTQTIKCGERDRYESCLGPLEVHRTTTFTSNAADLVLHVSKLTRMGRDIPKIERDIAKNHERCFDAEAFKVAIQEWRRAEGYVG